MFVLFLPILFGRHHLYAWMSDPSLTERNSWYLNMSVWWLDRSLDPLLRHLDGLGLTS